MEEEVCERTLRSSVSALHLDSHVVVGLSCVNAAPAQTKPHRSQDVGIHLLVPCSTSDSSGVQIPQPDSSFQRLTRQSEHPRFVAVRGELLLAWIIPGMFDEAVA